MNAGIAHRVVLDTNTIIGAGSRWLADEQRRPSTLLQRVVYAVATANTGLYCRQILDEYVELMVRRRHPTERIALYTAFIIELFTNIDITSSTCHTPPSDPDDLIFILCSLDGNADILVSDDRHLLAVRPSYEPRPAILPSPEAEGRLCHSGQANLGGGEATA
jgi:predicted nucleic acid-binding protein